MSLLSDNILENTDAKNLGFPDKHDFFIYGVGYLDKYSVYEWRNEYIFNNIQNSDKIKYKSYIKTLGIRVYVYNTAVHNKALERKHGTTYRIKIGYINKFKFTYKPQVGDEFYEKFNYLFDFDKLFNSEEEAMHHAYEILLKIKQDPKILNKTYYIQNRNNSLINDHSAYCIAHLKEFMKYNIN